MHYTRGQTFISVYRYRAEGNTPSPVVSREGSGGAALTATWVQSKSNIDIAAETVLSYPGRNYSTRWSHIIMFPTYN